MINRKRFVYLVAGLIILIALCFSLRGFFLDKAISLINKKLQDKEVELKVANAQFPSLFTARLNQVSLLYQSDSVLFCDHIELDFSLPLLFQGFIPFNNVNIDSGTVFIHKINQLMNQRNHDETNPADTIDQPKISRPNTLLMASQKILRTIKFISSVNVNMSRFDFIMSDSTGTQIIHTDEFSARKGKVDIKLTDKTEINSTQLIVNGELDGDSGAGSFYIKPGSGDEFHIPLLDKFTGVIFTAERLAGSFKMAQDVQGSIALDLNAVAVNPKIAHWRLGNDTVHVDSTGLNLNIQITSGSVKTSNSENYLVFNQVPVKFDFDYKEGETHYLSFNAGFEKINSQLFFNSLPEGMFNSLKGIETEGLIGYDFYIDLDFNQPDRLTFASEPDTYNFHIKKFGKADPNLMNGDFIHKVIEDDKVVRTVDVSATNRYFTPLNQISPYLPNAVMTNEDGTFYNHKGFNKNALRQSIATNIKEKRFARGGSTITMQLVKNVFLSRDKNISRKLEEVILVWMIENQKIVSKDRMLEVYLNIIEWGPGIYGIGEASEFYFAKKPDQLNLEESIYLSAIIPRPKYFKYTFNKEGHLQEFMRNYFNVVADRMVRKEIIDSTLKMNMNYDLELKGDARQFVIPDDSTMIDSLKTDLQPEELLLNTD